MNQTRCSPGVDLNLCMATREDDSQFSKFVYWTVASTIYAEELGSKNPGIFKGMGEAYRLLKDYDKALYYLNEALKRDATNEDFLIERSNIYIDIKKYPKAIDDLSDALSRKSTDPRILYKRGLAFYKNKEFKKAIKDLYTSL